jgi:hypothetical protein
VFPVPIHHGDTWFYGALRLPSATTLGAACAGTNGPPRLTSDVPYLGAPGFALDLVSVRPGALCAFGLALASQNLMLGGGCTLYLQTPFAVVPALASATGFASTRLRVPSDPGLRGVLAFAQAFVDDPQGAAGGFAVSAGRRLVLGD